MLVDYPTSRLVVHCYPSIKWDAVSSISRQLPVFQRGERMVTPVFPDEFRENFKELGSIGWIKLKQA